MHLALALLAGLGVPASAPYPLANLDFSAGLAHWEGRGFRLTAGGVTSADLGPKGGKALLHRTFVVPAKTTALRFTAAALPPEGAGEGPMLDVVLEAAGREFLPRLVRAEHGWQPAPSLLPPRAGRQREYVWPLHGHAGRRLRVALLDQDDRPGCHLVCAGFTLTTMDELNGAAFAAHMRGLQRRYRLAPMTRLESRHFLAVGNAPEGFLDYRLEDCETLHAHFFPHFRRRGFAVRAPADKLMVAVFDTQAGFEAYVGPGVPSAVTGIYHPASNRLVVYDFATNRGLRAAERRAEEELRRARTDLARDLARTSFRRWLEDRKADTNISTSMHEAAHQLCYNGGLLRRGGDAPLALIEGLACYCESTVAGAWQGIGEANPSRAAALAETARAGGTFLPLRDLIGSDDWLRKARTTQQALLGYAQSWALVDWLMKERPGQLERYLEVIRPRETPDRRLDDLVTAFGDIARLDRAYQAHLREVARTQGERR